jgi:transcriptional repressor NrdR
VSEDELAILAQRVEDTIRSRGLGEVPSNEVGLAILGPLQALDEVAYLRFASVYRGFESAEDFESEIATLRSQRSERRSSKPRPGECGSEARQNGVGDAGRQVAWQAGRGDTGSAGG